MTDLMHWQDRPKFPGTVISKGDQRMTFEVNLDDGQIVVASIHKHVARRLFRIVPGDRVYVKFRDPPRSPRIVGFAAK